jgi:hypothetical protein
MFCTVVLVPKKQYCILQQLELLEASSGAASVRAGGKGCLSKPSIKVQIRAPLPANLELTPVRANALVPVTSLVPTSHLRRGEGGVFAACVTSFVSALKVVLDFTDRWCTILQCDHAQIPSSRMFHSAETMYHL